MTRTQASVSPLPAPAGVRLMALHWLDQADAARERLLHRPDDEALHDFRVALRRLHSCLRTWEPWVRDTVRATDRRRMRRLARSTNAARDIEVQRAWLAAEPLPAAARAGAERLAAVLEAGRPEAEREAARAIHQFPALAAKLRRRLSHYVQPVDPARPGHAEPCGAVAATLAGRLAAELRARLDAVRAGPGEREAHSARITAKRLRYLIEPFRDDVPAGRAAVALLRTLQDDLGTLHDLDVLLLVATPTALESTGASETSSPEPFLDYVRERRAAVYTRVREAWCGGAQAAELFRSLDAFASALAERTPAGGFEIERKFLLRGVPGRRRGRASVLIHQGWLPGEAIAERIRRVRGPDGVRWYRTIKVGHGLVRTELEEEIDEPLFRALWRLTRGRRIRKRRYKWTDEGRTWVVDRFLDRDLVLAEIELDDPAADVQPPAWLAPWIVKEVTGDRRYENRTLACGAGPRNPETS